MIDPALPKSRDKTTNWVQYNAALKWHSCVWGWGYLGLMGVVQQSPTLTEEQIETIAQLETSVGARQRA